MELWPINVVPLGESKWHDVFFYLYHTNGHLSNENQFAPVRRLRRVEVANVNVAQPDSLKPVLPVFHQRLHIRPSHHWRRPFLRSHKSTGGIADLSAVVRVAYAIQSSFQAALHWLMTLRANCPLR